jgi:hypothetical protein
VGILECGQGMDIYDAVDTIIVLLKFDVVLNSPQVVANVQLTCGPGPGEDATLFQRKPPENILLSVT